MLIQKLAPWYDDDATPGSTRLRGETNVSRDLCIHEYSLILTIFLAIHVCLGSAALATSWTVAADGTGDFTVIQDAVDAASSGDEIMIGPGFYTESTIYEQNGEEILINVQIPPGIELTIVGAGLGETVIGAPERDDPQAGILALDSGGLSIEGCTFLNCWTTAISVGGGGPLAVGSCEIVMNDGRGNYCLAYYGSGSAVFEDCRFADYYVGIWASSGVLSFENCDLDAVGLRLPMESNATVRVSDSTISGRNVYAYGGTLELERCHVLDCGLRFYESLVASLFECTLNHAPIDAWQSASTTMRGCSSIGADHAIDVGPEAELELVDSDISALECALVVSGTASVTGSSLTSGETVIDDLDAQMIAVTASELIRQDSGVYYRCAPDAEPRVFDFTENSWGTTDIEEIRAHILDCNLDPELYHHCVEVLPLAGDVVTAEPHSWSDIKIRFR
jgi:hypothetical protein